MKPDQPASATQSFEWPPSIIADFHANQANGCVGTKLVSQTERVRVWEIRLPPGHRLGFHRHVLDYFWTAVTPGRARSHRDDGSTVEVSYFPGETQHAHYAVGDFKVHDLENIGDADLIFTTVEFLDSENPPLDLPHDVKARAGSPTMSR